LAIYSYRAATVRNILDFPHHFSPAATVIALERNYRSTQPILDAANAVNWRSCVGQRTRATAFAGLRVLQLLPGIGPATARSVLAQLSEEAFAAGALTRVSPPAAAAVFWPGLCRVIARLRDTNTAWQGQIGLVRDWYQPLLDRLYDYPAARAGDLDQVEQIAFGYTSRERFLTELTLDPPDASGAEAGRPLLDEDYLILSTIHSAKGQEWETVYILNLVDGCIPSDMATGKPEQIEEERRLLYVAMRRYEQLCLVCRMLICRQRPPARSCGGGCCASMATPLQLPMRDTPCGRSAADVATTST
jgi:superfamily I DNA/RNA helicase